jgi:RNA polymerase sigma-70 factor (ECF subfamily)
MTAFDATPHLSALRRYALVLTRDADAADDLVQEALLKALQARATFRAGMDPKPWLLSILHNTHVSRLRRLALETSVRGEIRAMAETVLRPEQPDRLHLGRTIEAMLALPEEQREALLLVTVEGLGYREAAEVAGVPLGTLMSRLARGREALREATGHAAAGRPQAALRLVKR